MPKTNVEIVFTADDRASREIKQLSGGIGNLTKIVGIGAGALGGIAAGALIAGKRYVDNAVEAQRMARATGAAVDEVSALTYAFQQNGLEADDLRDAIFETGVKIDDFALGTSTAVEAFQALDLELPDVQGRPPAEQFQIIIDRINEMKEAGVDVRPIYDKIFGGDLGQKIAGFAHNINDLKQEAIDFNAVIDSESAAAAEKFDRNLRRFNGAIGAATQQVARGAVNLVAPIAEEVAEFFGLIETDAEEASQQALNAFNSRLAAAISAGSAYGGAIKDSVLAELYEMASLVGITIDQVNAAISTANARAVTAVTGRRRAALGRLTLAGDEDAFSRSQIEGFQGPGNLVEIERRLSVAEPGVRRIVDALWQLGQPGLASQLTGLVQQRGFVPVHDQLQDPSTLGISPLAAFSQSTLPEQLLNIQRYRRSYASRDYFDSFFSGELTGPELQEILLGIQAREQQALLPSFLLPGTIGQPGLFEGSGSALLGPDVQRAIYESIFRGATAEDGSDIAGFGGGAGGGGGTIDGSSLIEASKGDPVRVFIAGFGGLESDRERDKTAVEIDVTEDSLFDQERLREFVEDIVSQALASNDRMLL